jgi:predicted transposase/invertase (TIGR01784 family)
MRTIKTKSGLELLLPKNDFLFKLIFGDERNKPLLKGFLQAVLGLPEGEFDVELLDPHLHAQSEGDKESVLDIRIRTKTGKLIEVEMQVAPSSYIFERICFYKDRMLVDQIGEGMEYSVLKKVISIVVADFTFVETRDRGRYHHCFRLMDKEDGAVFGDVEEVHTLELPKVPEESDRTAAWEWGKFIGVKNEEELEMLAEKSEVMKDAVSTLYRVSADDEVKRLYEAREKARRDEWARQEYGRQKGLAEGIALGEQRGIAIGKQEGIAIGLRAAAGKMKARGMAMDDIAGLTGLSLEELQGL